VYLGRPAPQSTTSVQYGWTTCTSVYDLGAVMALLAAWTSDTVNPWVNPWCCCPSYTVKPLVNPGNSA